MKKIPVIICATTARLPALLQAFNNKFLFTIEDSCKDATNLIKILRQVKDHHQLLLLLDSEIALRNNGQLPEHLYRNFAALKIVTVLNSSDDQVDIMKLCRLRCNYFLRRVWLDNIHLYTSMLAASADYYNSILYYKPYQWLRDVGALVAFDYSMIRHLDFIMQNKLRDEIVALTREDEDQLDYQASLIWDYLDKLLLMENNLRLGLAVKSPPKQTILLKQGDRLDAVYIESILKIEADGNYIYVHYINGSVSLRYSSTIKELKRITINTPICKVNKYTMINLRLVRSVKSDVISLGENHDVTLSPLCRKEFFRRFGE